MSEKLAVVGAGQMGHGIAEVFALAGYSVGLTDVSQEFLDRAKVSISSSLDRMVKSGKVTQEGRNEILSRVSFTLSRREAVSGSWLVVEAVPEILEMKREIFQDIEKYVDPETVIASNSSNIRISEISSGMQRPERAIGMHFFNPAVIMKLVEIIKGEKTSDAVFERVFDFAKKIGKVPIRVLKDSPGFVVNRINAPESLFFCVLVEKLKMNPADVDAFARSQGLPMGPYELMDYVGLDTVVHSLDYFAKELSPDYGSCRAFHDLVSKNRLGMKTGSGFYTWENGKAMIPEPKGSPDLSLLDVLAIEVNEASKIVEEGIASPQDIETGVKLGMNRPFGPVSVAEGLTVAEIREKLEEIHKKTGLDVFRPSKTIMEGRLKEAFASKPSKPKGVETGSIASAHHVPDGNANPDQLVELSFENRVAILTLSNGKNNLLNGSVLEQLEEAIDSLSGSGDARAIVIRGNGGVFSAGAELSQFFQGPMDFMRFSAKGQSIFEKMSKIRIPVIAAIDGYALGGGFELALACDIRIATERSKIGFPELTRGLLPGWGGTQRLPRLIGESRASYLILSAERISGRQAYEMGIVSVLAEPEKLDEVAIGLASRIAENCAPIAVELSKKLIYSSYGSSIHSGLEKESEAMGILFSTEDLREGISSFMQKRKAEFKGK